MTHGLCAREQNMDAVPKGECWVTILAVASLIVLSRKERNPMRRMFALLSIIGMLGITTGCNHTAGVCDCEVGPVDGWVAPVPQPGPGPIAPEPLRVMPRGNP